MTAPKKTLSNEIRNVTKLLILQYNFIILSYKQTMKLVGYFALVIWYSESTLYIYEAENKLLPKEHYYPYLNAGRSTPRE